MPTPSARAQSSGAHHVRLNTGVLAAAEKRLLVRIAGRLPAWVSSDHLTLLALLAMAGTGREPGISFSRSRRGLPVRVTR